MRLPCFQSIAGTSCRWDVALRRHRIARGAPRDGAERRPGSHAGVGFRRDVSDAPHVQGAGPPHRGGSCWESVEGGRDDRARATPAAEVSRPRPSEAAAGAWGADGGVRGQPGVATSMPARPARQYGLAPSRAGGRGDQGGDRREEFAAARSGGPGAGRACRAAGGARVRAFSRSRLPRAPTAPGRSCGSWIRRCPTRHTRWSPSLRMRTCISKAVAAREALDDMHVRR